MDDVKKMGDFELWNELIEAEKRVEELTNEYRQRGLGSTPLCQWSRKPPYRTSGTFLSQEGVTR